MALKILRVKLEFDVKGDSNDREDLQNRVYDYLQFGIEDESLEFEVDEEASEDFEVEE